MERACKERQQGHVVAKKDAARAPGHRDEYCEGTRAGGDWPVLRRLREVGITGLAIGAFGEATDDAHELLGLVATTGAAERWRDAMAPSPLEKNWRKTNPSPPKIET